METGFDELGPFVIGDRRYLQHYDARFTEHAAATAGGGARTFVRETPEGVRACIYYPDKLIRCLEQHPPQHGLFESNVDAFAVLVEELDHLLFIAERARLKRTVSLFELELHANVTKHLVLTRFLAGDTGKLSTRARRWVFHHLFDKVEYSDRDPAVRARYRDAARWSVRFLDLLARMAPTARVDTLRRFHGADVSGKLELIDRFAA